jgi:histidinol-phosphate aminotransferase
VDKHILIPQRREFLTQIGKSALALSLGLAIPTVMAQQVKSSQLPSRVGKPELLLHFNENSLGMSPKALHAAQQAIVQFGNRYPDELVGQLRSKLAKKFALPREQFVFGNGSTEVIGSVVAYANSLNATVVEPTPTFGDLRSRAKAMGMPVKSVPVTKDFVTDISKLKSVVNQTEGNILVNICNPNNPTGTIVDKSALTQWIREASDRVLFIVDEAYFEYAQNNPTYQSALPLIKQGQENLVVTRTFSKIYGMAGMRIGYGMAAPETAKHIDRYAASFNLSAAGVAAALASLDDQAFFETSLQSNNQAREILLNTLDSLGLQHIPSNTNFVLHRINSDLASYAARMKVNGIRVGRRMTKDDGWNRISIGQPDEMITFAETLLSFRERGWV